MAITFHTWGTPKGLEEAVQQAIALYLGAPTFRQIKPIEKPLRVFTQDYLPNRAMILAHPEVSEADRKACLAFFDYLIDSDLQRIKQRLGIA